MADSVTLALAVDTSDSSTTSWSGYAAMTVGSADGGGASRDATSGVYLRCTTDASDAVPSGATIAGVEITVWGRNGSTSGGTLRAGPNGTVSSVTAQAFTVYGSGTQSRVFGGPTDALGATSVSDLARIAVFAQTGQWVLIDAVSVKVYYTIDPNTPQKTTPTMTVGYALGWSNPNNVLTSDNARASKAVDNTSSNIITLNWTDTLPANAVLLGCVLKVEGYASSTSSRPSISDCSFVESGIYGGVTSYQLLSTTETTYTFGSATTLPSRFTSASRPTSVEVRTYQDTNTSTTHYIDYIGVELWWKLPGGGVNVLFLGECF